ncbi:MAG TPA: hypothetical protein VIP11_18235 [Gemmatimonadaceae bacterium]
MRQMAGNVYVRRSSYRTDRIGNDGAKWRNAYMFATIDCGQRTMTLLRNEYYASDSALVDALPLNSPPISAERIGLSDGLRDFYNAACGIAKP